MKEIVMKCGGRSDSDFQRMRNVLACCGRDRMRPELRGVLIEKFKGGVYAVGCDGMRLRRDFFAVKAEPGLYEIEVNNSRVIRLVPAKVLVRYPDYRKVIPSVDAKSVYSVAGKGRRFAGWISSALGCHVDNALIAMGDDESVEVHVQKTAGATSALVMRNDRSLIIVMPMTLDDGISEQLDRMQLDRLRRQRKRTVVKSRQKVEIAPWWSFLSGKRKAA
jgi:hypothetical protein